MNWEYKDKEDNLLPDNHYLWHIFDNSNINRFNMIKNVVEDIICHGNGFIYIERDYETGQPRNVQYSPANQTMMYYNPLANKVYYNNPIFSSKWDDGMNYMHFFMQPDTTGFKGASIPSFAYKTISLANATEKSANDYYASGGQLYGLITTNTTQPMVGTAEKQIKTLRQSWDEARAQSQGTGTVFIPADLKFQQLSSSAKDSAMVETRLYNITEIARFLNISPVLLGDLSHTQYGSIGDAQREFVIHTLSPYVVMMEEELNKKLIMPSRQSEEFIDLNENSILAVDQEKQANYLVNLTRNAIMTPNEARKILGLPQTEDGNKLLLPYSDVAANTVSNV